MQDFDLGQLRALSSAASEGTLEAAARSLNVTPSAISQRLKALEIAAGAVLLVRSKPIQVTAAGQTLLRLARQVELLVDEAAAELQPVDTSHPPSIPLAVNADSMATWVLDALAPLAGEISFDLHRDDQAHTPELLRAGSVMAAITSQATPVPGCRVTPLGSMRYRPMAAPGFAARWFGDGSTRAAWAVAPIVTFDRKDELQQRYLMKHARAGSGGSTAGSNRSENVDRSTPAGTDRGAGGNTAGGSGGSTAGGSSRSTSAEPPLHYVPSSTDFLRAVQLGFGWGMVPDLQSLDLEKDGLLVDLDPRGAVDVPLYWQQWQLRTPALDRVAEAVVRAAHRALLPPSRRAPGAGA